MSIASRINEIGVHLTKDWRSIEALTGEAEVDKNIENIATVLDNLWEELPHTTGTGESLTLNTKKGKMKVNLLGNTSQYTTTGKNLLEPKLETSTRNGITCTNNGDGSFTLNGTATVAADIRLDQSTATGTDNLKTYNGTYTLSCNELINGMRLRVMQTSTWASPLGMVSNNTPVTATFDLNNCFIYVAVDNGVTVNNLTIRPMLELGSSATSWEKYTGKNPAPNPDYPQPINVVSGDNTIVSTGKNLLPNNATTQTKNGVTFTKNDDGTISVSGTSTGLTQVDFLGYNTAPSQNIFGIGTFTLSGSINSNQKLTLRISRGSSNTYVDVGNTPVSFTLDNDVTGLWGFVNIATGQNVNGTFYPMVEKGSTGSTATTYEPYTSTSYPIHLGEHWLGWIGNYKDGFFKAINGDNTYDNLDSATKESLTYGEWYLEKKIGKATMNGSEYWATSNLANVKAYFRPIEGMKKNTNNNSLTGDYTNYFKELTPNQIWTLTSGNNGFAILPTTNYLRVSRGDTTDQLSDFKTWLSTHNLILYYILETPTYTQITGTLKDELESAWRANSYNGTTNISQVNNDLPFNLSVTALGSE